MTLPVAMTQEQARVVLDYLEHRHRVLRESIKRGVSRRQAATNVGVRVQVDNLLKTLDEERTKLEAAMATIHNAMTGDPNGETGSKAG